MRIRCDTSMKRSKEEAMSFQVYRIPKWKCNNDCERCICGMTFDSFKGVWSHTPDRKVGGK